MYKFTNILILLYLYLIAADGHKLAIQKSSLKEQQPMKRIIEKKLSQDEENITGYLKVAYHLAKRELPKE
jgi:hypothetical protein